MLEFFDNLYVPDHRLFNILIKSIWHIDVLGVAEADVREVYSHHYQLLLIYSFSFAQVEHFENVLILFFVAAAAEDSCGK